MLFQGTEDLSHNSCMSTVATLDRIAQRIRHKTQYGGAGRRPASHEPAPTELNGELQTLNIASDLMAFPKTTSYVSRVSSGDLVVGDMPPSPPTLRGSIGAVLVSAVRRALFWLIPRVQEAQRAHAEVLLEQTDKLRDLAGELQKTQEMFRASVAVMQEMSSARVSVVEMQSMINEDQLGRIERGSELLQSRVQRMEEQLRHLAANSGNEARIESVKAEG